MNSVQIVGLISIVLLLIIMAPRALAWNRARGTLLRNIAIWLAIFVALVAVYKFSH